MHSADEFVELIKSRGWVSVLNEQYQDCWSEIFYMPSKNIPEAEGDIVVTNNPKHGYQVTYTANNEDRQLTLQSTYKEDEDPDDKGMKLLEILQI